MNYYQSLLTMIYSLCNIEIEVNHPPGGVRPVNQKSTDHTKLTFEPCVAQIWSRNTLELGRNETCECILTENDCLFTIGIEVPNVAHAWQSRPGSGLSFQVKVLKRFKLFPVRSISDHIKPGREVNHTGVPRS
jgi:hypothetical protein